jgi:hypothetical protein
MTRDRRHFEGGGREQDGQRKGCVDTGRGGRRLGFLGVCNRLLKFSVVYCVEFFRPTALGQTGVGLYRIRPNVLTADAWRLVIGGGCDREGRSPGAMTVDSGTFRYFPVTIFSNGKKQKAICRKRTQK